MVYLTHWFRYEDRAKAGAVFMAAIPMSSILGSPLAGWILEPALGRIASWRWLFVVEGLPAILFGILTLIYLTDWPLQASWLAADERAWIDGELQQEKLAQSPKALLDRLGSHAKQASDSAHARLFLRDHRNLRFRHLVSDHRPTRHEPAEYGGDPTLGLAVRGRTWAMIFNGWHSDRTGERRWHTALPLFLGAACLAIAICSMHNLLWDLPP